MVYVLCFARCTCTPYLFSRLLRAADSKLPSPLSALYVKARRGLLINEVITKIHRRRGRELSWLVYGCLEAASFSYFCSPGHAFSGRMPSKTWGTNMDSHPNPLICSEGSRCERNGALESAELRITTQEQYHSNSRDNKNGGSTVGKEESRPT